MTKICALLFLAVLVSSKSIDANHEELYARAMKILSETPLIDGHNDIPWVIQHKSEKQVSLFPFETNLTGVHSEPNHIIHTDIPRLRKGGVGGVFWAAYTSCHQPENDALREGMEQVDVILNLIRKYSDDMQFASSVQEIMAAFQAKKVASLIGLEGGHMLDNSLGALRMYYALGVRYMTVTHSCNTAWAQNSNAERNATSDVIGLTDWGKLVIQEMNRLGMLVDVSHVSRQTMMDALAETKAPLIFSHSSARSLCNHTRNVPDDVLKLVAQNRGLVMINFYSLYVTCEEDATTQDVVDHVNYIRNLIGVDYVGLGSDYDGVDIVPSGLDDASKFPNLIVELLKDPSWTEEDIKKLVGNNLLRVLGEVEKVRDSLMEMAPIDTPYPE